MFQHVNPNGISVSQAKKDAKKYAKREGVSLSVAQDIIAFRHGRSTWAESLAQSRRVIELKFNESRTESHSIKFPHRSSISLILGQSGSGKSVLCYDIMMQLAKRNIPTTYLSWGIGGRDKYSNMPIELAEKFPKLVSLIDMESDVDLDAVSLAGGVLIVDEAFMLLRNHKVHDLLKASKHTFVVAQSLDDIISLPAVIMMEDAMQFFCFKLSSGDVYKLQKFFDKTIGLQLDKVSELLLRFTDEEFTKSRFVFCGPESGVKIVEYGKGC